MQGEMSEIPADFDLFCKQCSQANTILIDADDTVPLIQLYVRDFIIVWAFGIMDRYEVYLMRGEDKIQVKSRQIHYSKSVWRESGLEDFQDFLQQAISYKGKVLYI